MATVVPRTPEVVVLSDTESPMSVLDPVALLEGCRLLS